jgi:hypothetical protein
MRDDVMAACAGDARQLNRVLREFGPLCCLVTAGDLERAYRYAFADDMAEATALARHLIAWGRTAP